MKISLVTIYENYTIKFVNVNSEGDDDMVFRNQHL